MDLKKIWSQRFHAWVWLVLPVLAFMLLMQVATWLGLQPEPGPRVRFVRTLIGLLALGLAGIGLWRIGRAQVELLRVARNFASGRLESRASTRWSGVTGELAEQLNTVGKMLAHYRDHQDQMVIKTTSRLRLDQERLSELNRELRRALRDSQSAASAQSELFSNLSHELRTPLTAVLGYASLLRKSGLTAEQEGHLATLDRSARGMLGMINDLLDWSRIEAGQLKLNEDGFDVLDTVEETAALLAPLAYDKKLELIPILYHDVPRQMRGDGPRLRQILTNLLSNAIKFTERGEVVLRVMREREDSAGVWLRFSIADTGIGISQEQLSRLFRPFQQAGGSTGGSGLGLSITRRLAELMAGRIEVDSKPGSGSTFSVVLPFAPMNATSKAPPLPDTRLHERTIWVLESQPTARLALMHWLEFWGLRVKSFDSLENLRDSLTHAAPKLRPSVVILGLGAQQAQGEACMNFCRYCHSSGVPLLALVASASLDLQERLRAAGAAGYLPKSAGHTRLQNELIRLSGAQRRRDKPLAGKFVLITDNNLPNRRYLSALCAELGLEVSEAGDGVQALQLWQELQPEFVLMDARMPLMDGASCTREIRRREKPGAHCRIVAVSAHLEPSERSDFLIAGADAILIKPFDEPQLLNALAPGADDAPSPASQMLATDPQMLLLLEQELPQQFAELTQAFDRRDTAALREAAHQLHGSASFYHLADLKEACSKLESHLAYEEQIPLLAVDLEMIRENLSGTLKRIRGRLRPVARAS